MATDMWHYIFNFLLLFSAIGSIYDLATIKTGYLSEHIPTPECLKDYSNNLQYRTILYMITFTIISIINWKFIPFIWIPVLSMGIPKIKTLMQNDFIFFCFYTISFNIIGLYIITIVFYKINY